MLQTRARADERVAYEGVRCSLASMGLLSVCVHVCVCGSCCCGGVFPDMFLLVGSQEAVARGAVQ